MLWSSLRSRKQQYAPFVVLFLQIEFASVDCIHWTDAQTTLSQHLRHVLMCAPGLFEMSRLVSDNCYVVKLLVLVG